MQEFANATAFCQYIWHLYLEERDYAQLYEYGDPRTSVIGTGKHEISKTLSEFLEKIKVEAQQWDGVFQIEGDWYEECPLDDHVTLVFGEIFGREDTNDLILYDFHFRFSCIVEHKDGWKLLHMHQSVADINQASDEFFPKRLLKQSNETLRIKIAEKIRELEASNEAVIYYSHHDYLTKLINRYYFELNVQEAIEKQEPGMLLILDVDNFKTYNDTYGHPMGDQILIQLANAMVDIFKDGLCARIGGDEFAIYLPLIEKESLELCLDALISKFEENQENLALNQHAKTSIGVAMFPSDGGSLSLLMKHADEALYACKNKKEICDYCFYEEVFQPSDALENQR